MKTNKANHFQVKTFSPVDLPELTVSEFEDLARCYMEIFNEDIWNENWTMEKAVKEIKEGLKIKKGRKPLVSFLFYQGRIIGFAWIILIDKKFLTLKDMPIGMSLQKKKQGLKTVQYWLDLANQEKLAVYKELGVLKSFRNNIRSHIASELTLPLFDTALKQDHRCLICWTSSLSSSFKRSVRFGWHPICFFQQEDRIIFKGDIRVSIKYLNGILNRDKEVFLEMKENEKTYYCR